MQFLPLLPILYNQYCQFLHIRYGEKLLSNYVSQVESEFMQIPSVSHSISLRTLQIKGNYDVI